MEVVAGDRDALRQLTLKPDRRLHHSGSLPQRIRAANGLRLSAPGEGLDGGDRGIEQWIRDQELLLVNAIQSQSIQSKTLAEAVVEDSESAPDHVLGSFRSGLADG